MDNLLDELASLIATKVFEKLKFQQNHIIEEEVKKPLLLSTKEAAEYFGKHVNTIRKWISEESIPYKRISNSYYIIINQEDYDKRK